MSTQPRPATKIKKIKMGRPERESRRARGGPADQCLGGLNRRQTLREGVATQAKEKARGRQREGRKERARLGAAGAGRRGKTVVLEAHTKESRVAGKTLRTVTVQVDQLQRERETSSMQRNEEVGREERGREREHAGSKKRGSRKIHNKTKIHDVKGAHAMGLGGRRSDLTRRLRMAQSGAASAAGVGELPPCPATKAGLADDASGREAAEHRQGRRKPPSMVGAGRREAAPQAMSRRPESAPGPPEGVAEQAYVQASGRQREKEGRAAGRTLHAIRRRSTLCRGKRDILDAKNRRQGKKREGKRSREQAAARSTTGKNKNTSRDTRRKRRSCHGPRGPPRQAEQATSPVVFAWLTQALRGGRRRGGAQQLSRRCAARRR